MQTNIKQVGPSSYEFQVEVTADELAPDIEKELRGYRQTVNLKGFRPGKVPMSIVRKMFGREIASLVIDRKVQEVYDTEVVKSESYDLVGRPEVTDLDYQLDGDLRAVVKFDVRPTIELKDLSEVTVPRLVHTVTDEEVAKELERIRVSNAEEVPAEGAADENSIVVADVQLLDEASHTPVIGQRDRDVTFDLSDENIADEVRDRLIGRSVGDVVRVEITHEGGHEHEESEVESELLEMPGEHQHPPHAHTHAYEFTVNEVKKRNLPELDDELAKKVTDGRIETADALREDVQKNLEDTWKKQSRSLLREMITRRMIELHPFDVPESLVESYLDAYVEDFKQRNEGKLPHGVTESLLRNVNREEAVRSAKWIVIRDQVVKDFGVEVTDEDHDRYFETEPFGAEMTPDAMRRLYEVAPSLKDDVHRRLLDDKVFDVIAERVQVVEKDEDAIMEDLRAEQPQPAPAEQPEQPQPAAAGESVESEGEPEEERPEAE